MSFIVIRYENRLIPQSFKVLFETEDVNEAKQFAWNEAYKIYGSYVEDFCNVKKPYITKNFCFFNTIVDYSDWCVDITGYADNVVFSVIEKQNA